MRCRGMVLTPQDKKIPKKDLKVPKYADVMTTKEFLEDHMSSMFLPMDGDGYLIINGEETDHYIWEVLDKKKKDLLESASHVAWYNK